MAGAMLSVTSLQTYQAVRLGDLDCILSAGSPAAADILYGNVRSHLLQEILGQA